MGEIVFSSSSWRGLTFAVSAFCFLNFLAGSQKAFAEEPIYKETEGWQIRVDTTLGNGCFVVGVFEGSTVLRIGVNPRFENNLYFMIGDPAWESLEAGKTYNIKIYFGDESPWRGDAMGIELGDSVVLTISFDHEQSAVFLTEFMQERNVDVHYQNRSIANLRLKGSYKAGLALAECQQLFNEDTQQDVDPFGQPKKPQRDPFATPTKKKTDPFA